LAGSGAEPGPVEAFDRRIDEWFDEHLRGRPHVDRLFYSASALGDHGIIWLMLAAARGLRPGEHWQETRRVAVAVGLESAAVNGPVKWLFRRARPEPAGSRPLPLRTPRTSSFPSGHATSAFCAAALFSDADPSLAPLYYGLALIVAWSRVHVRIHHASDVVGGMVIGAAFGCLVRHVAPIGGQAKPAAAESRRRRRRCS